MRGRNQPVRTRQLKVQHVMPSPSTRTPKRQYNSTISALSTDICVPKTMLGALDAI